MHLLITGAYAAEITWANLHYFLTHLPDLLEMHVIFGPTIHKQGQEWLGLVVIAESHISVHTSGEVAFIDVFSCKTFEVEKALSYIEDYFSLSTMQVDLVERLIASKPSIYPGRPAPAIAGVS